MRIAEEYFRRLLDSDDALHAVGELQRVWSSRQGRSQMQRHFGLAYPEYVVHLAILYDAEVGNGGHEQLLLNPGGAYVDEMLNALTELELPVRVGALSAARSLFPAGVVPKDEGERETILISLGESGAATLDGLDKSVYKSDEDVDQACLRYLRRHEDEILRQERGLEPAP